MKPLIKFLNCSICFLILVSLTGCLPWPHTTEQSREVRGRVLDARTHAPILGAKIFLTNIPKVSCTSDSAGYFLLKATHQFQLAYNEGGGWPNRKFYEYEVTISHTNYISRELNDNLKNEEDIFLEPRK